MKEEQPNHNSFQHFHQKRAVTFTRSEMERLNQLKNLNHSNVNPFVGMTFNQNSELVVLWNYCVRGSLDDVCFGTGKRLGRNFQSTFLKHILHVSQRQSLKVQQRGVPAEEGGT